MTVRALLPWAELGAAFFLRRHVLFLMVYVNEWVKAQEDGTQVAETLFARTPTWLRGPTTRLLGSHRIHARAKTILLLTPLLVPLVFILPLQMVRSGANSVLDVLRHGVRSVPPLVTAVVVVFVTSDAWRILGKGFTGRFFALVSLFIVGGLFFLIRRSYWDDIEILGNEATTLLAGIRDTREAVFEFIDLGAADTDAASLRFRCPLRADHLPRGLLLRTDRYHAIRRGGPDHRGHHAHQRE